MPLIPFQPNLSSPTPLPCKFPAASPQAAAPGPGCRTLCRQASLTLLLALQVPSGRTAASPAAQLQQRLGMLQDFGDSELVMAGLHENVYRTRYMDTQLRRTAAIADLLGASDRFAAMTHRRGEWALVKYQPACALLLRSLAAGPDRWAHPKIWSAASCQLLSQDAVAQPDAAGLSLLMERWCAAWLGGPPGGVCSLEVWFISSPAATATATLASWRSMMREVLAKRLAAAQPGTVRGVCSGQARRQPVHWQGTGPTGGLGAAAVFMRCFCGKQAACCSPARCCCMASQQSLAGSAYRFGQLCWGTAWLQSWDRERASSCHGLLKQPLQHHCVMISWSH